ncbi:MAG TPA: M3 family metallopeptidase [Steroidobacteraceae bacterium]|nr:M3 family metallopeptidase [Steroidobacteraceae bacterium]
MSKLRILGWSLTLLAAGEAATACASPGTAAGPRVAAAEQAYAAMLDAYGARNAIESGLTAEIGGRSLVVWRVTFSKQRAVLLAQLRGLTDVPDLPAGDARVVRSLSSGLEYFGGESGETRTAHCADAARPGAVESALSDALTACFSERGDHVAFEGREMTRIAALGELQHLKSSASRKRLFLALQPLWRAINGDDGAASPYRRLIAEAAAGERANGSPIDAAARALGWSTQSLEAALVQTLAAWRRSAVTGTIEPWDYWFRYAAASRTLDPLVPRAKLKGITERFYGDLGADPRRLGVVYDLEPRAGKPPSAYTDFIRIGRPRRGVWRPAQVRVCASESTGGLFILDELVHESGHAVHLMAIRARPAYFWPDLFLAEAFANVPAWSIDEPAWQLEYLGRAASRSESLRERYAGVMLDMAWSLFEIRMLRHPDSDPNQVWTRITSHYLGITPHPEWSWWALRVQLVSMPGYMVNYGAGAMLTADLRARIRQGIGPFDTGNPEWYPWVSEHLLRFGSSLPVAQLLEQFLGREPSDAAVLADIERIRAPAAAATVPYTTGGEPCR